MMTERIVPSKVISRMRRPESHSFISAVRRWQRANSAASSFTNTDKLTRFVGKPDLIAARVARQIGTPRSHTNCGAFVSTTQNPPFHQARTARYRHDRGRRNDQ